MSIRNDNFPRQFDATVRFNHKFRFQATGATAFTVSRGALLNFLLVGTTTTSLARLIGAIKVNKITMYGIGESTTGTTLGYNTVSVEWLSDLGTTVIKSDTGNSFDPPKVETGPPLNSRASFWSRTNAQESEVLFKLTMLKNTIVDFDMSIVLYNDDTPASVSSTGVVVGQTYVPKIGTLFEPISYITI